MTNKMKNIIVLTVVLGSGCASLAFAQYATPTPVQEFRSAIQQSTTDLKTSLQEARDTINAKQTELRQQFLDQVKIERTTLQKSLEERKEEFRDRAATLKEEKEAQLKKIREEFAKKIQTLQDQRKKDAATRLVENLNRTNEKLSDGYLRHLENIERWLTNFEERANRLATERGVEIPKTKAKIAEGKAAIVAAKNLVLAQKAKVYSATVTSVDKLNEAFQTAMRTLRADHEKIREEVVKATKDMLRSALETLREEVKIEKTGETATTTNQ